MKTVFVNNGFEKSFDINDIKSGTYLIAASTEYINEKSDLIKLSDSDLIIIEK